MYTKEHRLPVVREISSRIGKIPNAELSVLRFGRAALLAVGCRPFNETDFNPLAGRYFGQGHCALAVRRKGNSPRGWPGMAMDAQIVGAYDANPPGYARGHACDGLDKQSATSST